MMIGATSIMEDPPQIFFKIQVIEASNPLNKIEVGEKVPKHNKDKESL